MIAARFSTPVFSFSSSRRQSRCLQARAATTSLEEYAAAVLDCEQAGDALRAVEVFTEVKVLKLQLPAKATEAGIRTFAKSGEWRRAHELYTGLRAAGHQATSDTVNALFAALAQGKQADITVQLLQELVASSTTEAADVGASGSSSNADNGSGSTSQAAARAVDLSGPYNTAIKACAAGGAFDTAMQLLDQAMAADDLKLQHATFSFFANELLKAGEAEMAETVLDYRDYL